MFAFFFQDQAVETQIHVPSSPVRMEAFVLATMAVIHVDAIMVSLGRGVKSGGVLVQAILVLMGGLVWTMELVASNVTACLTLVALHANFLYPVLLTHVSMGLHVLALIINLFVCVQIASPVNSARLSLVPVLQLLCPP